MKKDIHPQYFENAKVTCACGNTFTVGSTQESLRVELCSECHPFYTGKQKFVDTARRVEKFQEKMQRSAAAAKTRVGKSAKRAKRASKKQAAGTSAESKPKATSKKKAAAKKKITKKETSK